VQVTLTYGVFMAFLIENAPCDVALEHLNMMSEIQEVSNYLGKSRWNM